MSKSSIEVHVKKDKRVVSKLIAQFFELFTMSESEKIGKNYFSVYVLVYNSLVMHLEYFSRILNK